MPNKLSKWTMSFLTKLMNWVAGAWTIHNSPTFVADIQQMLGEIKEKNQKIVGSIYASSGYSNQNLVGRTVYFAYDCLDRVIGNYPDKQLITALLKEIAERKYEFEQSEYDPDGIVAGTLVDIENALQEKARSAE